MKKNQIAINTFFAILCVILFHKTSFAEPPNLAQLKTEVESYHDSGAYQDELNQVIARAQKYVIFRAKSNNYKKTHKKLAIVLDIDETSVSNYKYLIARDFVGTKAQIHKEIMAANAPAIKRTRDFYYDAIKHGITVFFVTGRSESERQATTKNLHYAGYKNWAHLYLKPDTYNQSSIAPFKSEARATISKQGYTIIASIGDQYSDLKGGYAEKTFKLPNPFYYLP